MFFGSIHLVYLSAKGSIDQSGYSMGLDTYTEEACNFPLYVMFLPESLFIIMYISPST